MNALEDRLGVLIERSSADLRDGFPPELRERLVLWLAASELLVDEWQPADAERLRMAVATLALRLFGVSDASIERCKVSLATNRDPESLNWRN